MTQSLTFEPGRVDELVARDRALRLQRFSTSTLTWLAAVPEWTDQLALDCGFPGMADGQGSADALIDALARARLVELRQELDPSGETITAFWVPESMRPILAPYLSNAQPRTVSQTHVFGIASAFEKARDRHSTQALEQWLAVAGEVRDPSGAWLVDQVSMRVAKGQTTYACGLVAAAQALGDVLGDPIASVARRARTRIDRGYREADDRRQLQHYYRRRAIEAELAELIWGRSPVWAIHLLGDGGMGKTSVVRYLASGEFARNENRPPILVARVDFDHLDPRYPEDRPAELLLSLAWDLTGYAQTRQAVRALRQVEDLSDALHESIVLPERRPDEQLLTQVVDAFAKYLGQLGDRIVLVLDTCEELAKLHAPGVPAPVVVRTFDLIERVARAMPGVRVVLAGRRWLARPAAGPQSSGEAWLPVRPYLKVVRVEGFSRAEAEGYLQDRSADGRAVLELREAILARCEQHDAGGETRYNPFELVAYADWAASDPALDEATLKTTSSDPYIEQRIIGRIRSATVHEALPIAVELGRFDRAMLERAVASRQLDANAAFDGLAGLEWIRTVAFTADGRPRQVEMDENVRKRLRAVIAADPLRFPLNRARLGRDLSGLLRDAPFTDLSAEAVGEAIRLLPVEEAGQAWEQLEARIAESEAWAWASSVVPFVAGIEAERSAGDGQTILAAIRATHAAATLRVAGRPGIGGLWREVEQLAAREPNQFRAGRLAARAACGLLAEGLGDDDASVERASELIERHGPMDSVLALLTGVPAERTRRSPGLMRLLNLACGVEGYSSAAALLVRAELALTEPDGAAAAQACDTAIDRARGEKPEGWIDWIAPPHLLERCQIARLRVALLRGESLDALPIDAWRDEAHTALADIDAERLLSMTLTFELAHRLPDDKLLADLQSSDAYNHERRPQASWHRSAPPLAVSIAAAWSAIGQPTRARDLLASRRELAIYAGDDPDTIRACDAALIALARTYRTTDITETVRRVSRAFGPDEQLRSDAWAALALNDGESPPSVENVGDWHGWWRAQIRRADSSPATLSTPATPIDAREALLLGGGSVFPEGWDAERERQRHLATSGLLLSDGTGETLGTILRADALAGGEEMLSPTTLEQLPARIVADAALAEGELLALRLPALATPLLALAEAHFKRANDSWGATRAAALGVLASARAGVSPLSAIQDVDLLSDEAAWDGWKRRIGLVDQLRSGPVTEPAGKSPELDPRPLPDVRRPLTHPPVSQPQEAPTLADRWAAPTIAEPVAVPGPQRKSGLARRILVVAAVLAALLVLVLVGLAIIGASVGSAPPVQTTPTALATLTPGPSATAPPPSAGLEATAWLGLGLIVLSLVGVVLLARTLFGRLKASLQRLRLPLRQDSVALSVTRDGTAMEIAACRVVVDTAGRFGVTRQTPTIVPLTDEGVPPVDAWASKVPAPGKQDVIIPFDIGQLVDQSWDLWFSNQLRRTDILCVRCTPNASGRAWAPLNGWQGMPTAYRGVASLAPESNETAEQQNALVRPHRLLHLVGAPVPTAGGWRLRVEGAQSEAAQVATRSTLIGEELLSADALPLLGSGLVVLQAEPVDGLPEALDSLRAGFCGFAQSVLDRGAAAVVLVPPLPDWLAAQVIDSVWQTFGLAPKQPSALAVLQFVSDVRQKIRSAHELDDDSALAPSLDVMLYFRLES